MGIKKFKPVTPTLRYRTVSDFADITTSEPEKSLLRAASRRRAVATTPVASPPAIAVVVTSGVTASSTSSATSTDVPGAGGDDRVRPEPVGPHRAAALRGRREALHRRAEGPRGRCTGGDRGARAAVQRGQRHAARRIPLGTLVHNIELKPGRGGQMARGAGTYAQLMAKEGEYVTAASPERRGAHGAPYTAAPRSARSATPSTRTSCSARPASRAGWAGARHVRGVAMNPVDHPHGWWRGQDFGWPSPDARPGASRPRARRPVAKADGSFHRPSPEPEVAGTAGPGDRRMARSIKKGPYVDRTAHQRRSRP